MQLPLRFIICFVVFIFCLIVIATTELVWLSELCKSLTIVSCLVMLHAIQGRAKQKNDGPLSTSR